MATPAPVLILDGGLGTLLEDKYHVEFTSAETRLWSSHLLLTDQATLLACHRDFVTAGADIISTATYQTSIVGFANTRTRDWPDGVPVQRIGRFLVDAVLIAGQAGENQKDVSLALGPYGATTVPSQEYGGVYDEDHASVSALTAWHMERMSLFAKTTSGLLHRVNYVAFETIPRLDEIIAIRQMMADGKMTGLMGKETPFWISCVFPGEDDLLALPDGTPVEDVVYAMLSKEVSTAVPWGIGINCTKVGKLPALVQKYEEVVRRMRSSGDIDTVPALVLYPDGTNGEVYNTTTQKWELPEGKEPPKVCGYPIQLAVCSMYLWQSFCL